MASGGLGAVRRWEPLALRAGSVGIPPTPHRGQGAWKTGPGSHVDSGSFCQYRLPVLEMKPQLSKQPSRSLPPFPAGATWRLVRGRARGPRWPLPSPSPGPPKAALPHPRPHCPQRPTEATPGSPVESFRSPQATVPAALLATSSALRSPPAGKGQLLLGSVVSTRPAALTPGPPRHLAVRALRGLCTVGRLAVPGSS